MFMPMPSIPAVSKPTDLPQSDPSKETHDE
jgi:hypothetical protein